MITIILVLLINNVDSYKLGYEYAPAKILNEVNVNFFKDCNTNDINEFTTNHQNTNGEKWKIYEKEVFLRFNDKSCFKQDDLQIKISIEKASTVCVEYETLYYIPQKINEKIYLKTDNSVLKPSETNLCHEAPFEKLKEFINDKKFATEVDLNQFYFGCRLKTDGYLWNNMVWWAILIKNEKESNYFEVKKCINTEQQIKLKIEFMQKNVINTVYIVTKQLEEKININEKRKILIKVHDFDHNNEDLLSGFHVLSYINNNLNETAYIPNANTETSISPNTFGNIMCKEKRDLKTLKKCIFAEDYKKHSENFVSDECLTNNDNCLKYMKIDQIKMFNKTKLPHKFIGHNIHDESDNFKQITIDYFNYEMKINVKSLSYFEEIETRKNECDTKNINEFTFENQSINNNLTIVFPFKTTFNLKVECNNNILFICGNQNSCSFSSIATNFTYNCFVRCGLDDTGVPFIVSGKNMIDVGDVDSNLENSEFESSVLKEELDIAIHRGEDFVEEVGFGLEYLLKKGWSCLEYLYNHAFSLLWIALGVIVLILILLLVIQICNVCNACNNACNICNILLCCCCRSKKSEKYNKKEFDIELQRLDLTISPTYTTYFTEHTQIKLNDSFEFNDGCIKSSKGEKISEGLPYEYIFSKLEIIILEHKIYYFRTPIYDTIKETLLNNDYILNKNTIFKDNLPIVFKSSKPFKLLAGNNYSKEKNGIYYGNKAILTYVY